MKKATAAIIVLFVALLIVSTTSITPIVSSKPIIKSIEERGNGSSNGSDTYIKEFNDLVSRVNQFVTEEELNNFKSNFSEGQLEKELNEKNIWDKFSIKASIKMFEQKTSRLRYLLENDADKEELIIEFRELIKTINEELDRKNILPSFFDKLLTRIVGLLMLVVSLLMIFLFPLGMTAVFILGIIEGIIMGDIVGGIASGLYGIYIYFPFAGALYFVGYYMFVYGYVPYLPP